MSNLDDGSTSFPPEIEAAVPAYMRMLRSTADELASQEEVERRAALLAAEHGLDPIASGLAQIAATVRLAHELGGPKAAEEMRAGILDTARKIKAEMDSVLE